LLPYLFASSFVRGQLELPNPKEFPRDGTTKSVSMPNSRAVKRNKVTVFCILLKKNSNYSAYSLFKQIHAILGNKKGRFGLGHVLIHVLHILIMKGIMLQMNLNK
jgi:hypothetical protein